MHLAGTCMHNHACLCMRVYAICHVSFLVHETHWRFMPLDVEALDTGNGQKIARNELDFSYLMPTSMKHAYHILTQPLSQKHPNQISHRSSTPPLPPQLRPRAAPASRRSLVLPAVRPSLAFSSPSSSPSSCTSSTPSSPPPSPPVTSWHPASSGPSAASCPSCPNPSRAANPPSSRWATTASSACSPAMLTSGR